MMLDSIKYCIWGCGNRGKHILQFMKSQGICAFIDSNPALQGTDYHGVPIISFDTYRKKYRNCMVIVASYQQDEIIQELNRYHIPYFSSRLLLPEIVETVYEDLFALAERRLCQKEILYFYGLNLYSLLLSEYLVNKEYKVKIVPGEKEGALRTAIERYKGAEYFCRLEEIGDAPLYMTSNGYYRDKLTQREIHNLYDFLFDIEEYYKPSLEKYRNLHQGKRCFIIGTGPSLRISDLDRLAESGDICIGLNGIIRAYSSTKWRPTYYMLNGPDALAEWGEELQGECRIEHMFMPDNIDFPHSDAFEIYHLSRLHADEDCPPEFTTDFSRGCYAFGVTYCALQFAAYLGCSVIYLYGIDCHFDVNYDYFTTDYAELTENELNELKDQNKLDEYNNKYFLESKMAYLSAKQAMEERGFQIYNASRKTWLDVFECVDFDGLFDKE